LLQPAMTLWQCRGTASTLYSRSALYPTPSGGGKLYPSEKYLLLEFVWLSPPRGLDTHYCQVTQVMIIKPTSQCCCVFEQENAGNCPAGEACSTPTDPLTGLRGATSNGRGVEGYTAKQRRWEPTSKRMGRGEREGESGRPPGSGTLAP